MIFLLEGMDKTGKSTVAELLRKLFKCDYMHMSAPAKFHTRDSYLAEMLHVLAFTAGKNVVIDRSWYGELVWPLVYGRARLLYDREVSLLTEMAQVLHHGNLLKIYMSPGDKAAHVERLQRFQEPTYDYDATQQRYELVASEHNFEFTTFDEAVLKWS